MLIKICGIKDPVTAAFAAENGADFIGFIVTPGFRRSISHAVAQLIAGAARSAGAEPVAVFVNASPDEILSTCRIIDVQTVQAYGLKGPLPFKLKRIYVNDTGAALRPGMDLLLMESNKPGQGQRLNPDIFIRPKTSFFIAGGLNAENVHEMIALFRPDGVDVSSGVEEEGVKSLELISKFIKEVKCCEY